VKESKTAKSYLKSFIDPRSYSKTKKLEVEESNLPEESEEYKPVKKTMKKRRKNKKGTLRNIFGRKKRGYFF
jgi:hypothetical protein